MSHLEQISDEGIAAMAASGSVAVLLPTTAFMLRLKPPPARKLIDDGVIGMISLRISITHIGVIDS